ncbi:hypothetical protein LCGC14_1477930, partial [marine sediment metagenome]
GQSYSQVPGTAYGAYPSAPFLGSGGTGTGGKGGGYIKIQADSFDLTTGNISSNGANSTQPPMTASGGAGSGGGIYLISNQAFSGANKITANGGIGIQGAGGGYGGGGAGGRVIVQSSSVSGAATVTGGSGNQTGNVGDFMAVTPYYDNGSVGGTSTGLRMGDPSEELKKWQSISWASSNLTTTYKIRLQARAADAWGWEYRIYASRSRVYFKYRVDRANC